MKAQLVKWFRMFFVVLFLTTSYSVFIPALLGEGKAYSQAPSLDRFETETQKAVDKIKDIVKIVLGVILIIGLIWVVWMVSQNHPKAKEAVIAWVVGIAIYGIGIAVIG